MSTTEQKEQSVNNLPAVPADPALQRFGRLGLWLALAESGAQDERALGAAAALKFYFAQELDLSPLAALELSVIHGNVFVGVPVVRALAKRAGFRIEREDGADDKACTAVLVEEATDRVIGKTTFTIEEATTAGLVRDRSAWKTYPARMLWHRASKFVVADYAPEVLLGIHIDDERDEIIAEGHYDDDPPGPQEPEPASDEGEKPYPESEPAPREDEEGPEAEPDQPEPDESDPDVATSAKIARPQLDRLQATFERKAIATRQDRLAYCTGVLGRPITSSAGLTNAEAFKVLDHLAQYDPDDPQTHPFPEGY